MNSKTTPSQILLKTENLTVSFLKQGEFHQVINNISYEINTNEIVGIVGESGSGKSVSSLAVLGLLPLKIAKIESGEILFEGKNLLNNTTQDWRKIRGKEISMIFQEPMSALNPSMLCGIQVEEVLKTHTNLDKKDRKEKVLSLYEKVQLPNPEKIYTSYPHQISGGQKQRVMIAMALACNPKLLIADEPTTALDVTVQREIINLLKSIQQEFGMSILFISHDLSLVSEIADKVLVMYKGSIVEQGFVSEIFKHPKHNYTKALIASKPPTDKRISRLTTIDDFLKNSLDFHEITTAERHKIHEELYKKPPILEVKNVSKTYFSNAGFFQKPTTFKAVDAVSFSVYEGETVGLVGESGCGKSTLGNAIMQLNEATSGDIFYRGKNITHLKGQALKEMRNEIQLIFQDPYSSLNPRLSIGNAIMEPMLAHSLYKDEATCREKTYELLERVGLSADYFNRFPHEFSGGQRQRIGIARTIALKPKLIICDESVSALDISVQAQVLNLLNELKETFGFSYIFISHDLAVVKYMSDQVVVMHQGKIEETNEADVLFKNPQKSYTQKLIAAIPKGF
uniref:ABC transporter ATP-binding protein n=1 Tax=Flavobacterium sp. TaxID=239 RepID=UPI00404B9BDC